MTGLLIALATVALACWAIATFVLVARYVDAKANVEQADSRIALLRTTLATTRTERDSLLDQRNLAWARLRDERMLHTHCRSNAECARRLHDLEQAAAERTQLGYQCDDALCGLSFASPGLLAEHVDKKHPLRRGAA